MNRDEALSQQMVTMVQVLFAVVLGDGLVTNKDVFLQPSQSPVASMALLGVFITAVLSWIDWHRTTSANPYLLSRDSDVVPNSPLTWWPVAREYLRIVVDLCIVALYARLALLVPGIAVNPSATVLPYLETLALVFAAYTVAGVLRKMVFGPRASGLISLGIGFISFTLLAAAYSATAPSTPGKNGVFLSAALALMVIYRLFVRPLEKALKKNRRRRRSTVGIDIDGVLADQITGVLERARLKYGLVLRASDITAWDCKLDDEHDIKTEIEEALGHKDYILSMPVRPGAASLINGVAGRHRVLIVTARPESTNELTKHWLTWHGLNSYDCLLHVFPGKKSLAELDYLVDDYPSNIADFLAKGDGRAILVSQPWNHDLLGLDEWLETDRLVVAEDLTEALRALKRWE